MNIKNFLRITENYLLASFEKLDYIKINQQD